MLPIRKRISRPFLAIIILIPITILILFNVIVSVYTKSQAEEDLLNAVEEIAQNLETNNELDNILPNKPNVSQSSITEDSLSQTVPNISFLLKNQNRIASAELVIFNRNGEISRLFNTETFVTSELADLIYEETEGLNYNEIGTVRYEGDSYYVLEVEYISQTLANKVVYVSKGLLINEFVAMINIVLIIVSIVITLIALIVSTRVTNAIARPIEFLTSQVLNMKSDEILVIDNKSDSIELQNLTAEINALNTRIYKFNESQKHFLHNASHELRTPLMSIQGYADGIEMGVFSDAKGTAHLISDQTKRLTKLVDSLLSLARAENFNSNKKLLKLNLSESLLELINSYNGYAVSSNIEIKLDILPNIYAISNSELLSGSVGNIISNAIRYAKTSVTISLKTNEKHAIITVRDDGDGIKNIENIFDRFSKGENGNFGLGLSIAKTSVEMMNGDINVFNDNGAVFEI